MNSFKVNFICLIWYQIRTFLSQSWPAATHLLILLLFLLTPLSTWSLSNYPPQIIYYGAISFSPFSPIKNYGATSMGPQSHLQKLQPLMLLVSLPKPYVRLLARSRSESFPHHSSFSHQSCNGQNPRSYHNSRSMEYSSSFLSTRFSRAYGCSSWQPASTSKRIIFCLRVWCKIQIHLWSASRYWQPCWLFFMWVWSFVWNLLHYLSCSQTSSKLSYPRILSWISWIISKNDPWNYCSHCCFQCHSPVLVLYCFLSW